MLNNKLFSVKATKYRNSNLGYLLALKISKLAPSGPNSKISFSTIWLINQLLIKLGLVGMNSHGRHSKGGNLILEAKYSIGKARCFYDRNLCIYI